MEFLSDPPCHICEYELSGALICFDNRRCEQHEAEMEEFRQSELYQEMKRLLEGSDD